LHPNVGRFIPILIPIVLKYGLNGLSARALQKEGKGN
ncbi:MAG: hypothetical protein RIR64_1140, partial [Bacteroidota bacterium]